jgi:hypothetical protein
MEIKFEDKDLSVFKYFEQWAKLVNKKEKKKMKKSLAKSKIKKTKRRS